MIKKTNKKAAMEMSVGTIVTIVLLMAVLVLGLTLVRSIFGSAQGAVDLTDSQLKEEISDIFGDDDLSKLAVYPSTRLKLRKGKELSPLGFSVRNIERDPLNAYYTLKFIGSDCGITPDKGEELIVLRRQGTISVGASSVMEYPILLSFRIPEDFPACLITYDLIISEDPTFDNTELKYSSIGIDVEIVGR